MFPESSGVTFSPKVSDYWASVGFVEMSIRFKVHRRRHQRRAMKSNCNWVNLFRNHHQMEKIDFNCRLTNLQDFSKGSKRHKQFLIIDTDLLLKTLLYNVESICEEPIY
ncbi:unnamed protein product [Calicophoron daubneyi]|uniref:Uncharacterized protein n=1 Tax=Calicophoron daubneyi TaxID=300641 RepID=A0AAV2TAG5_CALDB